MRDPDFNGQNGNAWIHRHVPSEKWPATLGHWLIHAPGRHPFWEYWAAAVIHLRPLEGQRPAHLRYPKAEHELCVFALEPDKPIEPDADDYPYMLGPDLVFHFDGLGDEKAVKLGEGYVAAIMAGGSPDSDFKSWWERTLANVVRQMKEGKARVTWAPLSQSRTAN